MIVALAACGEAPEPAGEVVAAEVVAASEPRAIVPMLPRVRSECGEPRPGHVVGVSAAGFELDGARHEDVVTLGLALEAMGRAGPLEVGLAFDEGLTLAQVRRIFAVLGELEPRPRLLVGLAADGQAGGVKFVPILAAEIEASPPEPAPAPTQTDASYHLAVDGALAELRELRSGRTLPLDAPIDGVVLVSANDHTTWRDIAAALARPCGEARLIEAARVPVGRIPTVRRTVTRDPDGPWIDPDMVRRIVRANINDTRRCYDRGLARDPTLTGRVSIQIHIKETGAVKETAVKETTLRDPAVGFCIAAAIRKWKFPRPERGAVVIDYPFVLEPG